MFPFHPKPPTLGKKLVNELKEKLMDDVRNSEGSSCEKSDCKTYQLRNGGPVQRAIRDDMLSLKAAFQNNFERDCGNGKRWTSEVSSLHQHLALGSSFSIYKETFRKKKFGIIHSPDLCPPRCDRDSYIQMVYSAALEFLYDEDLFGFEKDAQEESIIDDVVIHLPLSIVFAIFTIYTLYHTNILPAMPTKECTAMDDILSTLTMGLASDTVKYKMYRRAYKSPIRLSQDLYVILYQVRDVALLCIDQCQHRKYYESINKSDRSWTCSCSLARDCLHIIDKLEQEESFQLCEYTGPSSLEGLAGSKDYYHGIILKEDIPMIRQRYRDYILDSYDTDMRHTNDTSTSFDIKNNQLFDTYDSLLETIAQKLNKNIASSKSLRLVKEVRSNLEPVLKKRRDRRRLKHTSEIPQHADIHEEKQRLNSTNGPASKMLAPQSEASERIDDRTVEKLPFQYAAHFADGLKKGIMLALKDFEREESKSREDLSLMARHPIESRSTKNFDDWFLEGLYGESIENTEQTLGDEDIMDESSIISGEDQAEGIGLMHLRYLLNKAKTKRVHQKAMASRKHHMDVSEDEFSDNSSFSSNSLRTSGVATEMFQSLFNALGDVQSTNEHSDTDREERNISKTTSKAEKSVRKQQPRVRKRKQLENDGEVDMVRNTNDATPDEINNQLSDEESLETTGPGANALNILLSKIC